MTFPTNAKVVVFMWSMQNLVHYDLLLAGFERSTRSTRSEWRSGSQSKLALVFILRQIGFQGFTLLKNKRATFSTSASIIFPMQGLPGEGGAGGPAGPPGPMVRVEQLAERIQQKEVNAIHTTQLFVCRVLPAVAASLA